MRAFSPYLPPAKTVASSASDGYVTANDYSVANGATVTLTFISTILSGTVTANDYSVANGNPVALEFTHA